MIEEVVCEAELEKQKINRYINLLDYYWYKIKGKFLELPYTISNHIVYDYGHPYNSYGYTTKIDGLDIGRNIETTYESSKDIGIIFHRIIKLQHKAINYIIIAHMDTKNKTITCKNEEDYPVIKMFAEKIGYKKLIKCWAGAH